MKMSIVRTSAAAVLVLVALGGCGVGPRGLQEEAAMSVHTGLITLKGNPVTLLGDLPRPGERAPDFTALGGDMNEVSLSDLAGKVLVIASVPSLDTPVCSVETKRFNEEAAKLGDGVSVVTISMDLPFAQKRWCGAEGVETVTTLSDHRAASFGRAYGLLIKEVRLLARAVLVVDRDGVVRHVQLVREVSEEPDYDAVLKAVEAAR